MLARVAESLYWIGRNLERTEHMARFTKVQFFSTMDAPMVQNKDFTMRSILFMSSAEIGEQDNMNELTVWNKVIFDLNNPNSILSTVKNARENARTIRNRISTELWESINKYYLFLKNQETTTFNSSLLYQFSEDIKSKLAVNYSNISNTLLHNDVWHFIFLGIYIERAIQVLRIMRNKISDWSILSNNGENKTLMTYQWTILLKSLEAFDVHNIHYRGQRSMKTIFELILANPIFPRSISYTGEKLYDHLTRISVRTSEYEETRERYRQKLNALKGFDDYADQHLVIQYLEGAQEFFANTHLDIHKLYFHH